MLNLNFVKALALSLALAACASGDRPAATTLEGYWTGQFQRDGAALDVELQFTREGDSWRGAFSAPSLRAIGIPLRDVQQEDEAAHFVLAGDDTTAVFDGRIETGTLAGQYTEGDAHGNFSLARAAAPPPACVEAPASFANGDVMLAGTLLVPPGTGAPFPAVLFIHGSRAQHRDAARFEAIALCRAGIAALIYDKRGVRESGGDWQQSSFDDLAADAAAGLDWLAARPEIDAARIGIYGHSQGGSIAPLIAARWPRIAFVAAGAGAGQPMGEVERYSLRNAVAPLARD
ncbi:MAG: alpha/beta hydrolase family protein, partial [Vitreimonas sp.]